LLEIDLPEPPVHTTSLGGTALGPVPGGMPMGVAPWARGGAGAADPMGGPGGMPMGVAPWARGSAGAADPMGGPGGMPMGVAPWARGGAGAGAADPIAGGPADPIADGVPMGVAPWAKAP
jgi:hypothetical protein